MKVQEVKQSLETAFIDGTMNSNLAYQPEFISNDYKQGKKVLVSLEKELKNVMKIPILPGYALYPSGICCG